MERSLSTFVVPYEVASLADTTFMDVYPYFGNEEVPDNLKPLDAGENDAAESTGEDGE